MVTVSIARLRALLSYNPETGELHWRVWRGGTARAGAVAGTLRHGYVGVGVDGHRIPGHNIAWALHYGAWPTGRLDHRDLNRANNRITNLRPATNGQNMCNTRVRPDSRTGVKGVWFRPWLKERPYRAVIQKDGKRISLGTFDTITAAAARAAATTAHHGEFGRL